MWKDPISSEQLLVSVLEYAYGHTKRGVFILFQARLHINGEVTVVAVAAGLIAVELS